MLAYNEMDCFYEITGMNPEASFGNRSAARDCSTYQFRYVADDLQVTSLSELEFQQ
jgi:hypothetical protein